MNASDPAPKPNPHQGLKVLFIPIEFMRWQQARSAPYAIQLGLEEGFAANGVEIVTLPGLWDYPASAPASWLSRAKTLLAGQQFDQIWVTLVHCHFDDAFLEWLRTLAPVRIGFVLESMEYTSEACEAHPLLKFRRGYVEHQLGAMTHVLMCDEYDVGRLNAEGWVKAFWWPGSVPTRVITPPVCADGKLAAVFYGALYGERAGWLQREDLRELLTRPQAPEEATPFPQVFDQLQQITSQHLLSKKPVTRQHLEGYLFGLRKVRREIFDRWIVGLSKACAQINLPSYFRGYASRVVEAMAAGCPVISWDIPNRPRTRTLYLAGEEILLFRRDQPEALAAHIRHLQHEPEWAQQLAARAQAKVINFHTIEKRIRQVLDWITFDLQPDYGESPMATGGNDTGHVNVFNEDPSPNPNMDESARWTRISSLIERIVLPQPAERRRRILDVGCGRGWLAGLASKFGDCEGVEDEAAVAAQAQRLFPNLRFMTGTTESVLNAPDFQPYDLVLVSDVIEYVAPEERSEFVRRLGLLLKTGGHAIVATPRRESLPEWNRLYDVPGKPVEEWLAEPEVRQLFTREKFKVAGHERVFFNLARRQFICGDVEKSESELLAIYQVWAFQLSGPPVTDAGLPVARPETVRAEYFRTSNNALDRALQLLPGDPVLLTARAASLLQLGQPETARQVLVLLVASEPDHAPARRMLAYALHQLHRPQEADAQIRRAVQIESAPVPVVCPIR